MKKHLFSLFTAILLSLTCLIPVLATETETTQPVVREPGFCGENIRWSYDDGILTIDGEGLMDDFEEGTAPWYEYRKEIRKIVFSGGVTYVGAWSFTDFDKLETVDFGNSMYELGKYSFRSCDGLTVLHLPDTFKVFGEESLRNCKNLKEIHCTGRPLSFRLNSLWDTYATIYFPADRPWGVDYIAELEAAFHGRIQFIASDGTDPYDPDASTGSTETTEEPTEEPTEETAEETVPVKKICSSTLLMNSGGKAFLTAFSRTAFLLPCTFLPAVLNPTPLPYSSSSRLPTLDVMITIVFLKLTVLPLLSVSLPSSIT